MTMNMTRVVETFLLVTFPIAVFVLMSGESVAQEKTDVMEPVAFVAQESPGLSEQQAMSIIQRYRQQRFQAMIPLLSEAMVENSFEPTPEQHVLLFERRQHEVKAADLKLLQQHARFLAENPGLYLIVSGHSAHEGPSAMNVRLSERRALTVANWLLQFGAPAEQILVDYYGDSVQPEMNALNNENAVNIVSTVNKESTKSRRVELEYSRRFLDTAMTL